MRRHLVIFAATLTAMIVSLGAASAGALADGSPTTSTPTSTTPPPPPKPKPTPPAQASTVAVAARRVRRPRQRGHGSRANARGDRRRAPVRARSVGRGSRPSLGHRQIKTEKLRIKPSANKRTGAFTGQAAQPPRGHPSHSRSPMSARRRWSGSSASAPSQPWTSNVAFGSRAPLVSLIQHQLPEAALLHSPDRRL